jgi:hypothetical protein
MGRVIISIICFVMTTCLLIPMRCDDGEEEKTCESMPAGCIMVPPTTGDLVITVTIDSLNPNPSITIYENEVEDGVIADFCGGLCKNITATGSTIEYDNIPTGYYSVMVTYNAGDGNTVTAIDGGSNEPDSESYCEGTCYTASTAEIDVEFDSESFQDFISSKKDKCFIATAAYGSNIAPEVAVLRNFRNEVLMKSELGRAFVGAYYRNSPAIAEVIKDRSVLRMAARAVLAPIVYAVKYPLLFAGALLFTSMSLAAGIFARNRGKREY